MSSIPRLDSADQAASALIPKSKLYAPEESDNSCQRTTRIAGKVFATLLALLGGVSPVGASLRLAGTTFIGYVLVGANYIAFFSNTTWSFHKAIDEEMKRIKFSSREVNLRQESTRCKQGWTKVPVFIFSAASIVPDIYNAYVYNSKNLVFPIFTCLCGIGLPFYSLNLSFEAFVQERSKTSLEKNLSICRQQLQHQLRLTKTVLLSALQAQNDDADLSDFSESNWSKRLIDLLKMLSQERDVQTVPTVWQKCRHWSAVCLGYASGAMGVTALAVYNFVLGAKAAELIYNNPYFYYPAAACILLSNGVVPVQLVMGNSYKLINNLLLKPKQLFIGQSVLGQVNPVKRTLAGVASLCLAALSLGPAMQAVNDSFEGKVRYAMQVGVMEAVLLLTFNAMNYLVDESMKNFYQHFGVQEQLKVARWEQFIDQLVDDIDKYSYNQFAQFLLNLPEDHFHKIASDYLTREELNAYVNSTHPEDPAIANLL